MTISGLTVFHTWLSEKVTDRPRFRTFALYGLNLRL